jgi:hypothetical protein
MISFCPSGRSSSATSTGLAGEHDAIQEFVAILNSRRWKAATAHQEYPLPFTWPTSLRLSKCPRLSSAST